MWLGQNHKIIVKNAFAFSKSLYHSRSKSLRSLHVEWLLFFFLLFSLLFHVDLISLILVLHFSLLLFSFVFLSFNVQPTMPISPQMPSFYTIILNWCRIGHIWLWFTHMYNYMPSSTHAHTDKCFNNNNFIFHFLCKSDVEVCALYSKHTLCTIWLQLHKFFPHFIYISGHWNWIFKHNFTTFHSTRKAYYKKRCKKMKKKHTHTHTYFL